MDHTHSQLPLGGLYDAYDELLLATKDDLPIHEKVAALAHYIPHLAPRDRIRTVVDNSARDSASIDRSIVDYMANKNSCSNGCSSARHVIAALQALPPTPPTPPASVSMPSSTTINAGSKSALVVENDRSLLRIISELLQREGYVVRSAPDRAEGLRLYSSFAPFDVVLIDYCIPPTDGVPIDYRAPQQKHGIELALAIHKINPSQEMIIAAFDYQNEDEVPRRPTELTHVPVLVSTQQLRNLLEKLQYWARREEIDQAIAALTPTQWQKLQKFAEWKVRGFGRSAGNRARDLLQDALLSSFVGAQDNGNGRRWNKRVDFLTHLTGAMRGICSHWPDKFSQREVLECEAITYDAGGQELSPLDNLGPGDTPDERLRAAVTEGVQPAAERRLIAKEEIKRIFRIFQDDKEATLVLEGWSEGMKKSEVMQKYELTAKQYDAATKRIRVKLLGSRNGEGGAEKHGR